LTSSKSRFNGYPLGFKLLTAADVTFAVAVVGWSIYTAAKNSASSAQVGQAMWYGLNAAVIIAFALVLWRYRLRTEPKRRKKSVYALLALIVLLFLANVLLRIPS